MVLRDQDTLFKKVDSLMRGNPVEELEAALEASGRRIALAAPSFPRMGRTVDGGVLRLPDGSAKDLLALFRERAHMAVCHIPLARLRAEGAGLAADLVRREAPLLCLIDAVTEEDLSLAEIAENCGISRQGVRDVIVRAEAAMNELEDKTGLLKRFMRMQDSVDAIVAAANEIKTINYRQYENHRLEELADSIIAGVGVLKE